MLLKNKVAVVTGGSRGIGRAIAEAFVKEGALVAICSRNVGNLKETAALLNQHGHDVLAVQCNIQTAESVDKALVEVVAKFGRVDFLVNNSGVSGMNPIDRADDSKWMEIINTNLTGMYLVTKRTLQSMTD